MCKMVFGLTHLFKKTEGDYGSKDGFSAVLFFSRIP